MVTVLDGGMGSELIRQGVGAVGGLWSAQALIDSPETVVKVHSAYIQAGSGIITTNSYSTIPSYLEKDDAMADRSFDLTKKAGMLAREAVTMSGASVRVAGSLPPLSESYRPDLVPDESVAAPIYESMVVALHPYVDLYLCETMSSGVEAVHAVGQACAHGRGKPVLVSWTLNEAPGSGLRSGESVQQAFELLQSYEIDGYLFNCTSPEAILEALVELRRLTDKPIGGYPNRLNVVDPAWTLDNALKTGWRSDIDIEFFVHMAQQFLDAGATMIGGCCGIGPEYIAAFVNSLVDSR